jgi:hypothetical protein
MGLQNQNARRWTQNARRWAFPNYIIIIDIDMGTETDHIDMESFRLEGVPYKPSPIKTKKIRLYQPGTRFIAPIPLAWIAEAAKLPGHAPHVALAIMYVHGMKRKLTVVLTRYYFDIFSITRNSVKRGLDRLQEAGLIKYTRDGHKYKVTVIPVES